MRAEKKSGKTMSEENENRNLLRAVFEEDPAGAAIFEWLVKSHYNITSFNEDPYRTAFNEGRRAVIQNIINSMINQKNEDFEEEEINE